MVVACIPQFWGDFILLGLAGVLSCGAMSNQPGQLLLVLGLRTGTLFISTDRHVTIGAQKRSQGGV